MLSLGLKMRIGGFTALIASVLTTGLKAWHKFTASAWTGSNRLPDSSGNSNTGALFTGRGLSFDGVNDVVTVGATGVTVKSVVFYAYPDTTTQAFMQLQSTGAVRIEIASGTLSATGFTSPTLYVNGAASSTVAATTWQQIAVTSATGVSASNVLLGQSNATFYSGDLSNVKFFSVELSAAQIAELYANPEQALPTGVSAAELVGWWPINSGNSMFIENAISAKYGTVSGATTISAVNSGLNQNGVKGVNKTMFFDGVDDYINRTSDTLGALIGNFTIAAFIAPNQTNAFNFFTARHSASDRVSASATPTGLYITQFDGTIGVSVSATGIPVKGNHVAFVASAFSTSSMQIYLDGGSVKNGTSAISLPNVDGWAIGSRNINAWFQGYTGGMLYVAVWNTALTEAQILSISTGTNILSIEPSNLKGYWVNTGNTNNDWLDLSGNGKHGTVNGTPANIYLGEGVTTGKDILGANLRNVNTGQLILNGDGYASIADAATLDITSAVTLEAWVKPFQVSAAQTIVGKNSAYALNITSGAKLQFQRWSSAASGTVSSSASLAVDTWKHVCAVYNGTTTVLYINGAQDTSSGSVTGAIDVTSTDVLMGALTTSTQLFSGYLDSVKVYDAALTAAQVLTNYNAEKSEYGL